MDRQDLKSTRSLLQCDYCWRSFYANAKKDFNRHIMLCHTDRRSSGFLEFERDERIKRRKWRVQKAKLDCDHCHYGCVSRGGLFAHILRIHSSAVNVEWYVCEDCGKRCNQKNYLLIHIQRHLLTDLLRCDTCADKGKSLYCRRGFFSHFLTHLQHVPDEMKYVCDVCGFASARKRQDLWGHIVNMHMQPIDAAQFYVCNDCGSRLTTRGAMKLHIVDTHLGTRLSCDSCAFWTCWKLALAMHTQKHWPSRLRLRFECTDCNLQFNCNDTALYHRKKEHGQRALLVCDNCQTGKRWLSKVHLSNHQRKVHFTYI